MSPKSVFGLAGVRRWFRLPHRTASQVADDVDAEIDFHLEARARELTAAGMSPEAARALARREFGDVEAAREAIRADDLRHERRLLLRDRFSELLQDLRFGARTLRRSPGFTLVSVSTLAVGIGASTAIFGTVDGVLLRPLPYAESDRIVTLWQYGKQTDDREELPSGTLVDVRERATSFTTVAAAEPFGMSYQTLDGPIRLRAWLVTAGFFDVLGVVPQVGRTFRPDEHEPGRNRVVILSDGLWHGRFGGDPTIVGRTLVLRDEPYAVVGVMPPDFRFPGETDVWSPKVISAAAREHRGSGFWPSVARLRPGVTLAQARSDLARVASQLGTEHPATNAEVRLTLVPLTEHVLGAKRPALLLLLAASGLLLLIACGNVASLVLARTRARDRELGVRSALGAGRSRIVRLLVAEAAVLAALGCALGIALAAIGVRLIRTMSPADLPRVESIRLDARALAFAVVLSAVTAALFGLAPALRAARESLHDRLKAGGRAITAGSGRRRARAGLVVAEVALSFVLLVGAGLLVRSFVSLLRVDRGFRADHVLAVTVQLWQWYRSPGERAVFVREAIDRLKKLPGVRAAGVTSSLPLGEAIGQDGAPFKIVGRPLANEADAPLAHVTVATAGYFDALGIALRRGRRLTDEDDASAAPVVVVTEALARRHFRDVDPVGQRLTIGYMDSTLSREIVGVVADVRQTDLAADPPPGVFIPHAQAPTGALTFTVRTDGDPVALLNGVKRALWSLNGAIPVVATTLDEVLAGTVRERRFHLALLGVFAAVALLLAGVGVYGALSHAVHERRQEFGVRVALGARPADVLALVLGEGVRLVAAGAALGIALAASGAGVIRAMLFRVSALDPATFASVLAVVLGVAALATLGPARRAARVDPLAAMREDA